MRKINEKTGDYDYDTNKLLELVYGMSWGDCDICGSPREAGDYCDDCLEMLKEKYVKKELKKMSKAWKLKNR